MLVVTSAIANLIRENKTYRITSSIQTGHKLGMQLLDEHLFKLWKDGIITKESAVAKANLPDGLIERMLRHEQGLSDDFLEDDEEEGDDDPKPKRNPKIKYT